MAISVALSPRLLLVDDDEAACRLLSEVLERESYQIVRALSASEGLAKLGREGPFDAVLTDLRMPGSSGLDLLRVVRERDPNAIVIVLTAFGDAGTAGEAIRAGAHDFISKPYDIGELRLVLSRALERKRIQVSRSDEPSGSSDGRREQELELVGHSPAIIGVMKTVHGWRLARPACWCQEKPGPARSWWRGRRLPRGRSGRAGCRARRAAARGSPST